MLAAILTSTIIIQIDNLFQFDLDKW